MGYDVSKIMENLAGPCEEHGGLWVGNHTKFDIYFQSFVLFLCKEELIVGL